MKDKEVIEKLKEMLEAERKVTKPVLTVELSAKVGKVDVHFYIEGENGMDLFQKIRGLEICLPNTILPPPAMSTGYRPHSNPTIATVP